jgi:hypothetical protein
MTTYLQLLSDATIEIIIGKLNHNLSDIYNLLRSMDNIFDNILSNIDIVYQTVLSKIIGMLESKKNNLLSDNKNIRSIFYTLVKSINEKYIDILYVVINDNGMYDIKKGYYNPKYISKLLENYGNVAKKIKIIKPNKRLIFGILNSDIWKKLLISFIYNIHPILNENTVGNIFKHYYNYIEFYLLSIQHYNNFYNSFLNVCLNFDKFPTYYVDNRCLLNIYHQYNDIFYINFLNSLYKKLLHLDNENTKYIYYKIFVCTPIEYMRPHINFHFNIRPFLHQLKEYINIYDITDPLIYLLCYIIEHDTTIDKSISINLFDIYIKELECNILVKEKLVYIITIILYGCTDITGSCPHKKIFYNNPKVCKFSSAIVKYCDLIFPINKEIKGEIKDKD